MKTVGVFPVLLLLTACATGQQDAKVNLGGYPPAFRAGYIDGCESANRLAGRTRDENRFKSDTMYATGWRDGFDICKKGGK
jgi:hypothetical protein